MGQRTVITRFPFNGLPKGAVFGYDPETDERIVNLIKGGYLSDITPEDVPAGPVTQVVMMPSIESSEGFGAVNGEGEDQPHGGGSGGPEAVQAAGDEDVQGNEGDGAVVAKGRKRRSDVSTDG